MQARFELGTSEADLAEGVRDDRAANQYHGANFHGSRLQWESGLGRDDEMDCAKGELLLDKVQFEAPPAVLLHGRGHFNKTRPEIWLSGITLYPNRANLPALFELERILKCAPPKMHLSQMYADGDPIEETDSDVDFIKEFRGEVDAFYGDYLELAKSGDYPLGKPLLEQTYKDAQKHVRSFWSENMTQPATLAKIFGTRLLRQLEAAYGKVRS